MNETTKIHLQSLSEAQKRAVYDFMRHAAIRDVDCIRNAEITPETRAHGCGSIDGVLTLSEDFASITNLTK
jgi:hypothetical protein